MDYNAFTETIKHIIKLDLHKNIEPKLKIFLSKLRTKFEPINEVLDIDNQQTVGFECLITDIHNKHFSEINNNFFSIFKDIVSEQESAKIFEIACVFIHLESINSLLNK